MIFSLRDQTIRPGLTALCSLIALCAASSAMAQTAQPTPAPAPGASQNPTLNNPASTWQRGDRALLRGLDKVTAETRDFELRVGEPVQFGTLTVIMATPCAKRPPEETPEDWVGLQISDPQTDGSGQQTERKIVFSGWMLAQSPALSSLEHGVFDIWPLECIPNETAPSQPTDGAIQQP